MAKIMHITGLVRSAAIQRKRSDNTAYGTRLSILTEPEGDTCDVLVFESLMSPDEAEQLKGYEVNMTVTVSASAGTNGGAFLNVNAVKVDSVEVPDYSPTSEVAA